MENGIAALFEGKDLNEIDIDLDEDLLENTEEKNKETENDAEIDILSDNILENPKTVDAEDEVTK